MADLAITNSFSAGTAIVASQMNTNFTDVTTWANNAPNIGASGQTTTMDGALTVTEALIASSTSQFNGTVTVGVDDTGHDVKFFGATSGAYMLWDEDVDDLILAGDARLGVGITATGTARLSVHGGLRFTYAASAADIYTGIGATGTDVLTLCTAGSEVLKISSAGRVGIGIGPTGTAKLALNGGLRFTAAVGAGDIYTGLGAVGTDIVALCTAGTEKVRVTSAGLVGIGTDGPDSKLHVWGSTAGAVTAHADAQVTIEAALTSGLQFLSGSGQENRIIFGDRYDNDIGGITYDHDDNSMRFTTNTAERMRIMSDGRVGIGLTPSTNQMFQVQSTGEIPCVRLINTDASVGSANGMMYQQFTADADCTGAFFNLFADSAGYIGSITCASTSSIAFNTTSDYRIKSNVADLTDAVASVEDLRPITFTFTRDTEQRTHQGFLAHEVAEVYPGAVTGDKDAMRTVPAVDAVEAVEAVEYVPATYDEDGNELTPEVQAVEAVEAVEAVPEHEVEAHQMMDASKLVPLLTAAVQELTARIAALEAAA
jgi:hypothetical protein